MVRVGRTGAEDESAAYWPAARPGGPGYFGHSDAKAAPSAHVAADGDIGQTRRAAGHARTAGRPGTQPRVAVRVPHTGAHGARPCADCARGAPNAHVQAVFRVPCALRHLGTERVRGARADRAAPAMTRSHGRSRTTRARRHVGVRTRSHEPPAQERRGRTHSARQERHTWRRRCAVTEARAECSSRCAGAASLHVPATAGHGRRPHRPVDVVVPTVRRSRCAVWARMPSRRPHARRSLEAREAALPCPLARCAAARRHDPAAGPDTAGTAHSRAAASQTNQPCHVLRRGQCQCRCVCGRQCPRHARPTIPFGTPRQSFGEANAAAPQDGSQVGVCGRHERQREMA